MLANSTFLARLKTFDDNLGDNQTQECCRDGSEMSVKIVVWSLANDGPSFGWPEINSGKIC